MANQAGRHNMLVCVRLSARPKVIPALGGGEERVTGLRHGLGDQTLADIVEPLGSTGAFPV